MELPVLNVAAPVEVYEDPLEVMEEIDYLKKERDATILAHFYVDGDLQDIADFTGDSLKLARDATCKLTMVLNCSLQNIIQPSNSMTNEVAARHITTISTSDDDWC